ncbi:MULTISPECIES: TIGR02594 family protein [Halocynthiibacter]|uniref:TIGR02594 family protein n=1 Tax=Halocynthiibacter halioticoli TaxID=2986804 RepID=A0AAE3J4V0_9RHOB|nr:MULTISPECIES: TIGR02594 family protein [Halocynthiibacter]MCV6825992.1 TIGR02594 family protein [Halocynthiibacter halioticoli]MCW4058993.1 TIGR02594 family protein [Halocynthiibacter sp. SDUM655004]
MMHFTPPKYNAPLLDAAGSWIGLKEWAGSKHNPKIVQMFADSGHSWVKDDETPWCAAFVGSVLALIGLYGTGKLNARSYLDWGEKVGQSEAVAGDVVVLWRNHPDAKEGHVGFLVGFQGDKVIIRGGNQGNEVSDQKYPIKRVLGYRRAVDAPPAGLHTIRRGDQGPLVRHLQTKLHDLNYNIGRIDSDFGKLLDDGVRLFQKDNGLVADGIVGRNTWLALNDAQPRMIERDVTMKDLKEASVTIKNANNAEKAAGGGFGIVAVTEAVKAAKDAESVLDTISAMPWTTIAALGAVAVAVIYFSQKTKRARLMDAITGANVKR